MTSALLYDLGWAPAVLQSTFTSLQPYNKDHYVLSNADASSVCPLNASHWQSSTWGNYLQCAHKTVSEVVGLTWNIRWVRIGSLSHTVSLMAQLQVGNQAGHVVLVREAIPPPAAESTHSSILKSSNKCY